MDVDSDGRRRDAGTRIYMKESIDSFCGAPRQRGRISNGPIFLGICERETGPSMLKQNHDLLTRSTCRWFKITDFFKLEDLCPLKQYDIILTEEPQRISWRCQLTFSRPRIFLFLFYLEVGLPYLVFIEDHSGGCAALYRRVWTPTHRCLRSDQIQCSVLDFFI
jgi:hypothetical protein